LVLLLSWSANHTYFAGTYDKCDQQALGPAPGPRGTRRHPCQWSLSPDALKVGTKLGIETEAGQGTAYWMVSVQSSCHHEAPLPPTYRRWPAQITNTPGRSLKTIAVRVIGPDFDWLSAIFTRADTRQDDRQGGPARRGAGSSVEAAWPPGRRTARHPGGGPGVFGICWRRQDRVQGRTLAGSGGGRCCLAWR